MALPPGHRNQLQVLDDFRDGKILRNVAIRELAEVFIDQGTASRPAFERATRMLDRGSGGGEEDILEAEQGGGVTQPTSGPGRGGGFSAQVGQLPGGEVAGTGAVSAPALVSSGVTSLEEDEQQALNEISAQRTGGTASLTPEQLRQLATLVSQLNDPSGIYGPSDARRQPEVVAAIMQIMGLSNLNAAQFYDDTIASQLTNPNITVPANFGAFAPPGETPATQQELFDQQNEVDVRRRLIANQFGTGLSPLSQRAANAAFRGFEQVEPILNPGGLQNPAEAFAGFRETPPTRASLNEQLNAISNFTSGSPGAAAFNTRFATPNSVFSAGIQPFLSDVTPRLRGAFRGTLEDRAFTGFAQDPERFRTGDEALDTQRRLAIFDDLRRRGFLPSPNDGFQGF